MKIGVPEIEQLGELLTGVASIHVQGKQQYCLHTVLVGPWSCTVL
jgi:hypothetical protein